MVVALVATLLALAWLTHRASKLLAIPIPVLVKGLGLDIPAPPRVSLHNISADSIELHWSPPEKAGSVAKHIIQINGQNVGENERRDTSVVVTGLTPDQIYNVRVIAANSSNFQAPSPLIRLRTLRSNTDDSNTPNNSSNSNITGGRDGLTATTSAAGVSSGVGSAAGGSVTSGMNGVLGSGGVALGPDDIPTIHATDTLTQAPQSRRTFRRQNSPGTTEENLLAANGSTGHGNGSAGGGSSGSGGGDPASTDATVQALTAELEKIQRETEELEAQFLSQEEEHKAAEALLLTELEGVRDKKKEEDNIRSQLRTETRTLEDAKRAAEAQRSKVEKALKVRQDEISKMQEDCIRWDDEREAALEALHRLEDEAEARKQEAEDMGKNKRKELEPIIAELSSLEEEIRTLSLSIKAINDEEEKQKEKETDEKPKTVDTNDPAMSGILAGLPGVPPLARGPSFPGEPEDARIEREWQARFKALELRYMEILGHFRAAQDEFFRSEHQLRAWHARRASLPAPPSDPSASSLSLGKGKSKQRRNRTRKNRTQTVSSPMSVYPMSDLPYTPISIPFNQPPTPSSTTAPTQTSPPFPSLLPAAPLFNYANGTDPMFSPEMDKLTNGAPMSPTADSLLPSNLFMSMDEVPPSPKGSTYLLDSQTFPTSDNIQPLIPVAQSPVSSNSMSNSQLSSPRTSFPQFPVFSTEDPGRLNRSNSISSVNNSLRGIPPPMPEEPVPPKKIFPSLFSFTRPRGKTLSNDTPALGSLKPSQSNSFPKQDGPGLDPIGTRRRSGSHGTSWTGLGFLSNSTNIKRALNNANGSRSSFNHFDPESDPLDPSRLLSKEPLSPRPSSISSFGESILPKPSADFSAFGWPARDNTAVRASPLAANWADIPNINNSSSLIPSLPPSPQTSPPNAHPSRLAKIFSSKNSSSNNAGAVGQPVPSNVRLNPTAPTFDATYNNTPGNHNNNSHSNHGSSPSSHLHAETQSLNTESSFASSASLDQLALTTSITSVDKESAASSSVGKESLLSRIGLSRKGSHTKLVGGPGNTSSPKLGSPAKFTISSPFKKEGGLFGRKKGENSNSVTTPTTDVIDEEVGGLSGVVIPSLDHNHNNHSGLTTPSEEKDNNGNKDNGKEKEKDKEKEKGKKEGGKKGHGSSGSIGSASELFGSWRRESSEVLSSPFKKEGGFFGVIGGNKKKRGNLGVVDAMASTSEVEEDEGLVTGDEGYRPEQPSPMTPQNHEPQQQQQHHFFNGKGKGKEVGNAERDRELGATGSVN
ncbi:hypothetical protein TWF694_009597 [Orbilia ellipsospora]|uniref:Fibronectin type-III domain-containing protein n=1 Tax=Orbilia ellipsospora TaxID=2528407 RepID=A0AAV9XCH2_9PEZI